VRACRLGGPVAGLSGFAVTRIAEAPGADKLRLGMGVLFALALGMTGLLSWLMVSFSRRAAAMAGALTRLEAGSLPHLAETGERELDRIVAALNAAGTKLAAVRAESDALAARVALSERLAALGRVAAGVAHEIRNPVAAMRLKAENALAGDDTRRQAALGAILGQIDRLERLTGELLTMTQRREPHPVATDVRAFLLACAADYTSDFIDVAVETEVVRVDVDADFLRRALDSLMQNAVRHSPKGGVITLRADYLEGMLRIAVADTGAGVPKALRNNLFDPFVTGRADGTGLGLAIAREIAQALGGQILLTNPGPGAVFTLEVPCHPS
jgi:signal transduction histidine kinase